MRPTSLVGRDAVLADLADQLALASRAHRPGHVLLGGDAGVGKTRLLDEVAARAAEQEWVVSVGHCLDVADTALPYLPISEAIAGLGDTLPDVVGGLLSSSPELSALGRVVPGRRVSEPEVYASPDRGNLFHGLRTLLETVAGHAPLLLIIEDAHWADQSTRDLLTYLFARPFRGPVTVVVSYRTDDLHRRHPLRRQVAEWGRIPAVDRVVLTPLDDAAAHRLVHALEDDVDEAECARIVSWAEGNPFFVEELLGARSEARAGRWVPDQLADLMLARLDRLDEAARTVVRTASVSGRRVSHDLLAAVVGDTDHLDAALRASVEAHTLRASTHACGDTYSFRHALLAEAIYDDLLPGERARIHGRYSAALAADPRRGSSAELARHARLAHDPATALEASVAAGCEALEVGGPDEAAEHFEAALSMAADPSLAERIDQVAVTLDAAGALNSAGRSERAASLLADQIDRIGDEPGEGRARMLALRAVSMMNLEFGDLPLRLAEQAVAALPEGGAAGARARVFAQCAQVLAEFAKFEDAERFGIEALALAERHDLHSLATDVVTTLSGLKRTGPQRPLREALEEAVHRARAAGAIHAELRGRCMLGRSFEDSAEFDEAVGWFREAVRIADRAGIPWAPYAMDCRWRLAAIAIVRGEWDRAVRWAEAPQAPEIVRALLEAARLEVDQARGEDVTRRTAALRRYWAEEGAIPIATVAYELTEAGRRRDPAAVIGAYDEGVAAIERIWAPHFSATIRLSAIAIGEVAPLLAEMPTAERPGLLADVDRLHAAGASVLASHRNRNGRWGPEGAAWAARLDAERLRAHWMAGVEAPTQRELLASWRECVVRFEEYGHVHRTATARASLAEILRACGEPAAAREQADLALEAAHRLGARPLVQRLRAGESGTARSPRAEALTAREQEILVWVAMGRSNGEIGRQLFISTKTVSVHVSRILAKLGAAGRTEAAVIARRRGLLD